MRLERVAQGLVWALCWLGGFGFATQSPGQERADLPRQRTLLTGSRVVGSPDPPLPYQAVVAYPDLKAKKPVFLVADPVHVRSATRAAPGLPFEEYERFIVGQHQQGVLLSFAQTGTGRKTNPFLKVPGIEVLSLAFHPRYAENRFVFLHTLQ
jgi:hypothetical protein